MKCLSCGKKLDGIDCECGMCTFCGTDFDTVLVSKSIRSE